MHSLVQIIGDVPVPVVREIESLGFRLVYSPLSGPMVMKATHAVMHVPRQPGADVVGDLEAWLDEADAQDTRVGITAAIGMTTEVAYLMFKRPVHVLRLLNHGENAFLEAVAQLLAPDAYQERPKDDDVPIGSHFSKAADPETYALQRQLSLSSATMEPFLQKLRDVVLAMQTPLPRAVKAALKGRIPWDPYGRAADDAKKLPANPSLADVFRLHATPETHRRLHPAGVQEWSTPKLLLLGESGVGKSLVARLVSQLVDRALSADGLKGDRPFVTINCAGLSDEFTHHLFGAGPDMFTGIQAGAVGDLAKAAHGTAFLDEIGDMDISAQRSLLVYLQDGMVRPVGIEPFQGFTRVIAATNRDVPLLIERRQFRHDLAARFDFQVEIPTLRSREPSERERLVDFAALNPVFNPLNRMGEAAVTHISRNALTALARREYQIGNFRELETTVHTAIAKARLRRSRCIRTKDLPNTSQDLNILDNDANVIGIRTPPQGQHLDVDSESDLVRAAQILSAPVLRDGSGNRYVVAPNYVLRLQQNQT